MVFRIKGIVRLFGRERKDIFNLVLVYFIMYKFGIGRGISNNNLLVVG